MRYSFYTRLLFLLVCLSAAGSYAARAQVLYGTTSNGRLISFNATSPATLLSNMTISGLGAGQVWSGIDFRPATGELYALGYNSSTGAAQLYVLNTSTAAATMVGSAAMLATGLMDVSFDFNPTVDRIRVVSRQGNNYRLHPVTGALAFTDLNLAYAAGDQYNGSTPQVGAVAYTNSYIGGTATLLYDLDAANGILATQNPPNNGTLNSVGLLGVSRSNFASAFDMDIYYNPNTNMNMAYVVGKPSTATQSRLFSLNLMSGMLSNIGNLPSSTVVTDIAAHIDRTVPANIMGYMGYAVNTNNMLLSFDTEMPRIIRTAMAITGIPTTQVIAGLDIRPANGMLYALGYNATTQEGQLYTISTATGAATAVNTTPVLLNLGMNAQIGFDFNPTVDKIRVVSANGANLRLDPTTGGIFFTDLNLMYNSTDANMSATPMIATAAYTNSFMGATATALYNYDYLLNNLTQQTPPNNGTLNTLGSSMLMLNTTDPSHDLDIAYDPNTMANNLFLCGNIGTSAFDNLYSVSTANGSTMLKGSIGYGIAIREMALQNRPMMPSKTQLNTSQIPATLAPTVAQNQTDLLFTLTDNATVSLQIHNLMGSVVATPVSNLALDAGNQRLSLDISSLASGMYLVTLHTNGQANNATTLRLIKQ